MEEYFIRTLSYNGTSLTRPGNAAGRDESTELIALRDSCRLLKETVVLVLFNLRERESSYRRLLKTFVNYHT